jgi:polyisoprenoid-binding protein YceI
MNWTIDPMHTQVEFSARHMGIMTVKGNFTGVQAAIDFNEDDFTASSVEATIDPRTLTTNDERRDTHLKSPDFLNVEKFPTIAFKSTRIEHAAHDQYKMTGDLTIRKLTRPVTLDVVYSGQGKDPMGNVHAGFSASTTINRKDWGLTWNVALETGGLLVGEEVKLALEVEAVRAAEIATVAEGQSR